MIWVFGLIWGTWLFFGLSAVWGLTWAARNGHLRDVEETAHMIFDEVEPVGEVTDWFPGEGPRGSEAGGRS